MRINVKVMFLIIRGYVLYYLHIVDLDGGSISRPWPSVVIILVLSKGDPPNRKNNIRNSATEWHVEK